MNLKAQPQILLLFVVGLLNLTEYDYRIMRIDNLHIKLYYNSIVGLVRLSLVKLPVLYKICIMRNGIKVSAGGNVIEKIEVFSNALIRCDDWGSYIIPNWVEELKDNAKRA